MSLIDTTARPASTIAGSKRLAPPNEAVERLYALTWTRRATLLAVASVLVFAAAAFAIWVIGDTVVPWDSKNQFYPFFRFLGDALQHGEIPLWNPYHFAGHPWIADPQSLVFTPSMMLFALVAPHASMRLFDAVIFAHLTGGGLGMVGLARRRCWHPAAGVLMAMIFMLGGAASARLQHTGMIISYSYFPLAFWTLEIALERISYRFAIAFGLLATFMAVGRDQVAFLLCGVLAARVVWSVARSGAPASYLRARLGIVICAAVIVIGLMAIPVLLTMQFLDTSNRPAIPFGMALAGSLAPVNFMTMLAPNIFGSLGNDYWGPAYNTMAVTDFTDRAFDYLFIGTAPILLVIWHGLAAGRLFHRGARFFTFVAIAAILYALGRYTPVFPLAFDWIPGVALYRRPADAAFLINIALAFGAGYLLHRYIRDGLPHPFRHLPKVLAIPLPAAIALGTALLVGSGLAFSFRQNHLANSLAQVAVAVLSAALVAALLYVLRAAPRRPIAAILIVAATGGELIWRDAASTLNAERVSRYSIYATPTQSQAAGLAVLRQDMAMNKSPGERPRVEILGLVDGWENASMMLKLENTLGYNPLRIADYERAVGPGENAVDLNVRHFPGTFRGYRCRLASLLGLEYLVLGRPSAKLPRHFPRPVATLIYAGDSMYVYKLNRTAPRTYFAAHVKSVDSNAVLEDRVLPDFDRTREALIDRSSIKDVDDAVLHRDPAVSAASQIAITEYHDSSVKIDVQSDIAGVVVLHDLYYPGWEVRVDGKKEPVLRANILFRGVEVPAGHHKVEFSFHPLSLANLVAAGDSVLHRHVD